MPSNVSRSSRSTSTRSTSRVSTSRPASTRATGHSGQSSFSSGTHRSTDRAAIHSRARFTSRNAVTQRAPFGSSTGTLRRGSRNESVRQLQERLNASGFDSGPADGRFGPNTQRAVREYQRSVGLRADGVVGRRTFTALKGTPTSGTTPRPSAPSGTPPRPSAPSGTPPRASGPSGTTTTPAPAGSGTNGVARMDNVLRGRGRATGTITVNGNTYQYNSGSSRLFSTPTGTYRVTAHRNSRSEAGFVRNGVGFSFLMEDPRRPGSDRFYDPRAGRDRQNLRIHPDGGAVGTAGCLGLVGDAATMRRFRDDMNAELRRNGGSYTLRVQ